MRKAAVNHPIAASVIITILFLLTMTLGSLLLMFSPPFFYRHGDFVAQFVPESLLTIAGVALMAIFGYGKVWNNTEKFGSGLVSGGYFIVISLYSGIVTPLYTISDFYADEQSTVLEFQPLWKIAFFVMTMLLIGLAEEAFFRGIVANLMWDKHAKDPAGVWTAAIYSGLVFGLMHSINLMNYIQADGTVNLIGVSGVLVQMISAIAMGMALTAVYYRSKNIWVVVFIHAFLDFCAMIDLGIFGGGGISEEISSYNPLMAITSSVPYFIVTFVLLRKRKVIQMLTGDETVGMIPQAQGQLVVSVDMPSEPASKKSRNRAVIIAIALALVLFVGSVLTNQDFIDDVYDMAFGGGYAVDYLDYGDWDGEQIEGHQISFSVDKARVYDVFIASRPSNSKAYAFVQIKQGDDILFESNYGGKCSEEFSLELDCGNYEVVIIYNFSEVLGGEASYYTVVKIR